EIVELGTRYGIVTPYTSYLATDGSDKFESDAARGNNSRVISQLPLNNRDSRNTSPGLMSSSGQSAVVASKKAKEQQNSVSITADADETIRIGSEISVRKVGVKTFYLENDFWVDSEFKAEAKLPEIKLKFASDEYFDLIGKEPQLAKFFALGEQVVLVWNGKVYRAAK
ncbi:MAG TPA: hypothetical protein VF692_10595, partial [Pyrinomonadaceae bacterium]